MLQSFEIRGVCSIYDNIWSCCHSFCSGLHDRRKTGGGKLSQQLEDFSTPSKVKLSVIIWKVVCTFEVLEASFSLSQRLVEEMMVMVLIPHQEPKMTLLRRTLSNMIHGVCTLKI